MSVEPVVYNPYDYNPDDWPRLYAVEIHVCLACLQGEKRAIVPHYGENPEWEHPTCFTPGCWFWMKDPPSEIGEKMLFERAHPVETS